MPTRLAGARPGHPGCPSSPPVRDMAASWTCRSCWSGTVMPEDEAPSQGDDRLRPLSKRGRAQAVALVPVLSGYLPRRILSSPSVRCCETVRPTAEALSLPVESIDELAEGNGSDTVRLVRRMAGEPAVLCTHGDVATAVLDVAGGRRRRRGGPAAPAEGRRVGHQVDRVVAGHRRAHPAAQEHRPVSTGPPAVAPVRSTGTGHRASDRYAEAAMNDPQRFDPGAFEVFRVLDRSFDHALGDGGAPLRARRRPHLRRDPDLRDAADRPGGRGRGRASPGPPAHRRRDQLLQDGGPVGGAGGVRHSSPAEAEFHHHLYDEGSAGVRGGERIARSPPGVDRMPVAGRGPDRGRRPGAPWGADRADRRGKGLDGPDRGGAPARSPAAGRQPAPAGGRARPTGPASSCWWCGATSRPIWPSSTGPGPSTAMCRSRPSCRSSPCSGARCTATTPSPWPSSGRPARSRCG